MSSQIIHLKARADSLDRSRIPAMETIRVLAAALGRCSWAGLGLARVSVKNSYIDANRRRANNPDMTIVL